MKRREFSNKVKFEIVRRAMDKNTGKIACEGCGLTLHLKAFEIDHIVPEGLVVDKSKPLTAKDGQLLGYCCHRGPDGKTAADVGRIAKAKRQERKHIGIRKPSRWQTKWKRKVNGTVERRDV